MSDCQMVADTDLKGQREGLYTYCHLIKGTTTNTFRDLHSIQGRGAVGSAKFKKSTSSDHPVEPLIPEKEWQRDI